MLEHSPLDAHAPQQLKEVEETVTRKRRTRRSYYIRSASLRGSSLDIAKRS